MKDIDHHLSVREWSPSFCPASDVIEEIAIWVRISGLLIEYYNVSVISFIGDRIGKTIKVDKNTLSRES